MNKTCETVTAANGRRADKEQSEDEAGDVDDRTKQAALGTQKGDSDDESTKKATTKRAMKRVTTSMTEQKKQETVTMRTGEQMRRVREKRDRNP